MLRVIIILVLIAVVSCAQLLFQRGLPHTPNEDLARHVALALNFREALQQGQYIPRLQPHPVSLPDIPVYQFYGFLSSAVSQVGLWFHFPAVNSVILGVALCRAAGLMAFFFSLKRIGVSAISSIIACCAYIFFPYIQTNLYGRVAIPEACAHGLLPFLFMGYVYAITGKGCLLPVLLTALGIVFLALSHPIFLLWGFVIGLVLAIVSLWMSIEYRYRRFAILIAGILFGLAISSFQWYPAFISLGDFNSNFTLKTPYDAAYLTSLSGFLGFPNKFSADGTHYYFTGAIWVLPVIGLSILLFRKITSEYNNSLRMVVVASLAILVLFLPLSISPFNIWVYLPRFFFATQLPYRLLAFVGLFSAVLLCLILEKMITSSGLKIVLLSIIVALSGLSLVAPGNIFGPRILQQSDSEIVSSFSSFDYASTDKGSLAAGDGWLIKDNLIHLPKSEIGYYHATVRGHLGEVVSAGDLSLWFVSPSDSSSVVSDIFTVNGNRFEHTFDIQGGDQTVRLISSKYVRPSDIDPKSGDIRLLSIMIDGLNFSDAKVKLILPSEIRRKVINGYTRMFTLGNELTSDSNIIRPQVLILPVAYSRFNEVTQDCRKLPSRPNHAGLTQVNVDNISTAVISVYRHPVVITVVSVASVIIFFFLSIYCYLVSDRKPRFFDTRGHSKNCIQELKCIRLSSGRWIPDFKLGFGEFWKHLSCKTLFLSILLPLQAASFLLRCCRLSSLSRNSDPSF